MVKGGYIEVVMLKGTTIPTNVKQGEKKMLRRLCINAL